MRAGAGMGHPVPTSAVPDIPPNGKREKPTNYCFHVERLILELQAC